MIIGKNILNTFKRKVSKMRHYNSKIIAHIIMCLTAVTFIITSCEMT